MDTNLLFNLFIFSFVLRVLPNLHVSFLFQPLPSRIQLLFFRFRFHSDWNWLIFDVRRRKKRVSESENEEKKKFRKHTRIKRRFILILTTRNSFQFISSLCFVWLLIFYHHHGSEITNKQVSKRTLHLSFQWNFVALFCVILCSRSFHLFILRINKWIQLFIWKTRTSERTNVVVDSFSFAIFQINISASRRMSERNWAKENLSSCLYNHPDKKYIYFRGFFDFFLSSFLLPRPPHI